MTQASGVSWRLLPAWSETRESQGVCFGLKPKVSGGIFERYQSVGHSFVATLTSNFALTTIIQNGAHKTLKHTLDKLLKDLIL